MGNLPLATVHDDQSIASRGGGLQTNLLSALTQHSSIFPPRPIFQHSTPVSGPQGGEAGLGWAGLGWAGLGWAGMGWAGMGTGKL